VTAQAVIGVDLGGTSVRAVAVGPGGKVLYQLATTHTARDYQAVLSLLSRVVTECRRAVDLPAAAAGVALAGWFSADREELLTAANLGIGRVPLRRDLEQGLGLPVAVDNDGNAAALAEARAGAGRAARMLVMLTIGTGVGGGIVAGGSLLTGAAGLGGELGHIPADRDGPLCACGGRGCLEAYASGPAIARSWPRAGKAAATAEDVVAAARSGDPTAAAALRAAGAAIGRVVAGLVPVLNPDIVLLGGGLVMGATDLILVPARLALADALPLSRMSPAPPVRLASCGAGAGALGAAYLPGTVTPSTLSGVSA
jgi:glucokinase